MDEIEATNILKRCNAKKTVIKSPAFLFVAIWSNLSHSWPGVNYICKAKYKTFGNRSIHYNFPLRPHLAFLKDLFFEFVSFVLVAICISVSLLGNR